MAEETPQFSAEQPELAQIQFQPEQATTPEDDALTQGLRLVFQQLRDHQYGYEAAREQGLGL